MGWYQARNPNKSDIVNLEKLHREKKRRQPGIEFPSAKEQEYILIIRFDISRSVLEKKNLNEVRIGLKQLCTMFEEMDKGNIKIDDLLPNGDLIRSNLSNYNFSATVGFGKGFFEKLNISSKNYPKKLKEMSDNIGLGDSKPYNLLQTDFIVQICSNKEYVNHWVFQHLTSNPESNGIHYMSMEKSYPFQKMSNSHIEIPREIYSAIYGWATIVDMHAGFQRLDGKNLLGFNDGISNPKRLSNDVVWTTTKDEDLKFTDGTYMVFQKIEHDLEKWRTMSVDDQEKLIGRSKGTGLLLGTLTKEQDRKLASEMISENQFIRERARRTWKKLYDKQKDPDTTFFDTKHQQYRNIQLQCPVWSHVRKSNPRQSQGAPRRLIYRRGYLFIDKGGAGVFSSGLLFICFQKDIEKGFEYIKKEFLSTQFPPSHNKKYSINTNSKIEATESATYKGKYAKDEMDFNPYHYNSSNILKDKEHSMKVSQYASPSEHSSQGGYSNGQIPGTTTLGGGYYFIPPIPNKRFSEVSEQFFL